MQTEVLTEDRAIARAVKLLWAGDIVALPTETVYGLAADALNEAAVAKIFEAKQRPLLDPLIVHVPTLGAVEEIAAVQSEIVHELMDHFWPGPLTIVLAKRNVVPEIVTADLPTVALRLSAHPIFRQIIAAFGRPLAAPSANRFGCISPTHASHVVDELGGRIPLIVDGGATNHGLESTIVQIVGESIEVLRRGPITLGALQKFGPVYERKAHKTIIAPGQFPSHYAPRTRLLVVDNLASFQCSPGERVGALCFRELSDTSSLSAVRRLSEAENLQEAATNLFRMLRELDQQHLDLIVAELVPGRGIGAAINDRLLRAAH